MVQTRNSSKRVASSSIAGSPKVKKTKLSPLRSDKSFKPTAGSSSGSDSASPTKSALRSSGRPRKANAVAINRALSFDDGTNKEMANDAYAPAGAMSASSKSWWTANEWAQGLGINAHGGNTPPNTPGAVEMPKVQSPTTKVKEWQKAAGAAERTPFPTPQATPTADQTGLPVPHMTETQLPTLEKVPKFGDLAPEAPQSTVPFDFMALLSNPRALKLEEVADALFTLRQELHALVEKHFSWTAPPALKGSFKLSELSIRYPELVANVSWVADGSQYGWRHVFVEDFTRPHLVASLISHYVVEHVFKHTCFGLNSVETRILEDTVLKRYIHYDSFVRVKKLAENISIILDEKLRRDFKFDFDNALHVLSESIFQNLKPFYKPPRKGKTSKDIVRFIAHAGALSLGLRLSGGTPARTAFAFRFPNKHSTFQLSGRQSCVNKAFVDRTAHHAPDLDHDELQVKMSCWPSCTAVSASGPDMLSFAGEAGAALKAKAEAGQTKIPASQGGPPDNDGAFVTETILCPSDVYCEWTPVANPIPSHLKLTLRQAIAAERQRLGKKSERRLLLEGAGLWLGKRVALGLAVAAAANHLQIGPKVLRNCDIATPIVQTIVRQAPNIQRLAHKTQTTAFTALHRVLGPAARVGKPLGRKYLNDCRPLKTATALQKTAQSLLCMRPLGPFKEYVKARAADATAAAKAATAIGSWKTVTSTATVAPSKVPFAFRRGLTLNEVRKATLTVQQGARRVLSGLPRGGGGGGGGGFTTTAKAAAAKATKKA